MNLKQALALAREKLATLKEVDNPDLEAEVLLKYTLQIDRVQMHLNRDKELTEDKVNLFRQYLERRLQGEPTAYIIRQREFFWLDFYVDSRVLIPRPESELLVEEALKLLESSTVQTIADIGTGSGAIAISLAVNLFHSPNKYKRTPKIYATDISSEALEVACLNACKHNAGDYITFLQGDLLNPLPEKADMIIANLPYVTRSEVDQMPSAKYEPRLALDGGENGLDLLYRISSQLKDKINSGGYVLLEIGLNQSHLIQGRLRHLYPETQIDIVPDLSGIDRMVKLNV